MQTGQVERIREKTFWDSNENKGDRVESEVTVGSGEQHSDQEHYQQEHVLRDTAGRLTCVGWQRPVRVLVVYTLGYHHASIGGFFMVKA